MRRTREAVQLALGLMAAVCATTAMAMPTESTPVPKAFLAVEDTLDQATTGLVQRLGKNADDLDAAANQLSLCNADVSKPGASEQESAAYLGCRQQALEQVKAIYTHTQHDLQGFVGHTQQVIGEVGKARKANTAKLETYRTNRRKLEHTQKVLEERARKVARSLPTDGAPLSPALFKEMTVLKSELRYVAARNALNGEALKRLGAIDTALGNMGDNLQRWAAEGSALASQYGLDASLVEQMQQVGRDLGEAHILLSQFHPDAVQKVSKLLGRMRHYDFNSLSGAYGALPDTAAQPAVNLGGDDPRQLVEFFKKYRN